MSTIDIRKHYKQWLIEQGLKAKTSKGHTSTVNEYLRRIDRICDKQYKRHNASAWNKLAKNISDILVVCYECTNKEYFVTKDNMNDIITHFNNNIKVNIPFKIKLSFICQNKEQYITLISSDDLIEYLSIFQKILEEDKRKLNNIDNFVTIYLMRQISDIILKNYQVAINKLALPDSYFSDLILHIEYMSDYNAKDKAGLNKFYQFLSNPPANDNTPNGLYLAKLKGDRKDDDIKNGLISLTQDHNHFMKFYSTIHKTGNTALQVIAHPQRNGFLCADEVAMALDIDPKTLWRLKKDGILLPDKNTLYSENKVNTYLQEHFHKTLKSYSTVDYSQKNAEWINRREVAKILNVTERTILNYTKKGLLTYTDYSPKAPRYYRPEIEFISQN